LGASGGLAVAESAARYWSYAKKIHVRNGAPTAENLKHLLRLYVDQPAADFAPSHLNVVREGKVEGGWSRTGGGHLQGKVGRLFSLE
jgi:hypothetical protein